MHGSQSMPVDQLEVPTLLETGNEGSMDHLKRVSARFGERFERGIKEKEYKDDSQVFG